MPHKIEDEVAALRTCVVICLRTIRELGGATNALRALLVRRGVVSQHDFDQMYAEALTAFDRASTESLMQAMKDASDAELLRQIEKLVHKQQ